MSNKLVGGTLAIFVGWFILYAIIMLAHEHYIKYKRREIRGKMRY